MPMIKLTELFKFSPDGMAVVEYPAGEHELDGRALEIAQELGIVGAVAADPLKMNKDDLKAWLTAKGITFDAAANKDALLALVPK